MEAVASTELDDAIFPTPPEKVETVESTEERVERVERVESEVSQQISEIKNLSSEKESSQENWEADKEDVSEEIVNTQDDDDDEDKKTHKKKELTKKRSRIRRLFTGMRLKKNEDSDTSSEEDEDTESEVTLESREASGAAMEEGALTNKTTFTRIIHRVQTRANRMWEQIGQKLGGRADSEEDEMTEESSKSLSFSLSDVKQGGDVSCKKGADSNPSLEVVRNELDLEAKGSLPEILSPEDSTGSKGRSGTLRRIASGIKSGLMPSKQKNKN